MASLLKSPIRAKPPHRLGISGRCPRNLGILGGGGKDKFACNPRDRWYDRWCSSSSPAWPGGACTRSRLYGYEVCTMASAFDAGRINAFPSPLHRVLWIPPTCACGGCVSRVSSLGTHSSIETYALSKDHFMIKRISLGFLPALFLRLMAITSSAVPAVFSVETGVSVISPEFLPW